MNITLHPQTEKQLVNLRSDLPHALLIHGKKGTGLTTIAKQLAGRGLVRVIEPVDSKGAFQPETGTIAVATIRELYEQTRAKTTTQRIVIIDNAERLSLGAQAAFLKLLEEPSSNTHFFLTSHHPQILLPTIRSRVQSIAIRPITAEQNELFIKSLDVTDEQTKRQLDFLAHSLPAELTRLVSDPDYFEQQASIMGAVRTFLSGSLYERLLVVNQYYQDKAKAMKLIEGALTVSQRSLQGKPHHSLVLQLERLLEMKERIEANCNTRLQLTAFVLQ